MVCRGVELQDPAGPTDRHVPLPAQLRHRLAFFRRITSCSISLSSDRSATSFRSRPFSSSSCFSRRIFVGSSPSYFFFQLKLVAWLIPARRQISATGAQSAPCFRMNAFCASETCDASSPNRLARTPLQNDPVSWAQINHRYCRHRSNKKAARDFPATCPEVVGRLWRCVTMMRTFVTWFRIAATEFYNCVTSAHAWGGG